MMVWNPQGGNMFQALHMTCIAHWTYQQNLPFLGVSGHPHFAKRISQVGIIIPKRDGKTTNMVSPSVCIHVYIYICIYDLYIDIYLWFYIYLIIYLYNLYMIIYDYIWLYIYISLNLVTSIQHHRFAASPLHLVQAFLHDRSGLLLGCLQKGWSSQNRLLFSAFFWWKLSGNS